MTRPSSTTPRTRRIRTGSSCSPTSSVRCAFAGPRPSTAWFLLRAAAAPNQEGDKTGGINRIFGAVYAVRRVGKALKKRSQPLYYLTKWLLVGGILAWIFL